MFRMSRYDSCNKLHLPKGNPMSVLAWLNPTCKKWVFMYRSGHWGNGVGDLWGGEMGLGEWWTGWGGYVFWIEGNERVRG